MTDSIKILLDECRRLGVVYVPERDAAIREFDAIVRTLFERARKPQ